MIARNEADMIEDCIKSAAEVVDEIIVVDTGSTDKTREMARALGAQVHEFAWTGSFSEARNHALDLCAYEWALLLDADERLDVHDIPKLRALIADPGLSGAHFKVRNLIGNGAQHTVHNALRLLRNTRENRFSGDIHEQVTGAEGAEFVIADVHLIHLGYLDAVVAKKGKSARNLEILQREIARDPENPFMLFNLGNEYMATRDYEKALKVYRHAMKNCDFHKAYAPHLLFRQTMCLYELKHWQQAVRAAEEGLRTYSECTDLMFLKGQILMEAGLDTMAIECFEKALEMGEPPPTLKFMDGCGDRRPLFSLGMVYKRQRDYRKAAAFFGRAIATDNQLHIALYEAAECLVRLEVSPIEVENNLSSLFSDPEGSLNQILLSDVLLHVHLPTLAAPHIRALSQAEGCAADVAILDGKLALYEADYARGIEQLKKAHSLNPPRALARGREEALIALGLCALLSGDVGAMDDAGERIGAQFGKDAVWMYRVMRGLLSSEKIEETAFENPDHALAFLRRNLELVLRSGAYDAFEKLLYALNTIDRPHLLLMLAGIYEACGLFALAADTVIRSISELNEITPEGARILSGALWEERYRA